jgi:hypothetical protein
MVISASQQIKNNFLRSLNMKKMLSILLTLCFVMNAIDCSAMEKKGISYFEQSKNYLLKLLNSERNYVSNPNEGDEKRQKKKKEERDTAEIKKFCKGEVMNLKFPSLPSSKLENEKTIFKHQPEVFSNYFNKVKELKVEELLRECNEKLLFTEKITGYFEKLYNKLWSSDSKKSLNYEELLDLLNRVREKQNILFEYFNSLVKEKKSGTLISKKNLDTLDNIDYWKNRIERVKKEFDYKLKLALGNGYPNKNALVYKLDTEGDYTDLLEMLGSKESTKIKGFLDLLYEYEFRVYRGEVAKFFNKIEY